MRLRVCRTCPSSPTSDQGTHLGQCVGTFLGGHQPIQTSSCILRASFLPYQVSPEYKSHRNETQITFFPLTIFQLNGELLEDRGHFIPWAQPRPWFTAGTQHMVSCLDETLVLLSGVCFPELLAVTHPKVPHQQLHCSQREGFL